MPDPTPLPTIVTKREGTSSQLVETTSGSSDVQIVAMPWWQIVTVRTARVYVQALVGMLTIVMSGIAPDTLIAPADFFGKLQVSAGLAIAPATVTVLQNLLELLMKLDVSRPTLRG